ncbi:2,3-bisphosphoglycerate-independent phosphoglycerate mutase [Ruegeria sp. MALMAid1280]|uniref:2,3-bisphosphoglycerate-independent phosphoglycerate mutase n=1 Tax=Ruegeria sp. MALMAid1280 TaxID=3411634 RepID=UPI003B9DD28B
MVNTRNSDSGNTVVLAILDGWGLRADEQFNAIRLASTPTVDAAFANYPFTQLIAHGEDVGLPSGQMGNSEVGHTNIGAGRVVEMDLPRLNKVFESANCREIPEIKDFISEVTSQTRTIHLFGILSDGGVHGHQSHLIKMANTLAEVGLTVRLHVATDGRDVAPKSALHYLAALEAEINPGVEVATIGGRYYAMDRNENWDRTRLTYDVMCGGGEVFPCAHDLISASYANGILDEFIVPARVDGFAGIKDRDALLFMNFRADRVRQISTFFGDNYAPGVDLTTRPILSFLGGLVKYSDKHEIFLSTLFPEPVIRQTLGECVSKAGLKQIRIAETEKYAHVTFFLNGGIEEPFLGEERVLQPSPDVATYDLIPEMAAEQVAISVCEAIASRNYDLVVVNFANPDMVGHSGKLDAAIKACEAVDRGLERILDASSASMASVLVTADHGNCEVMQDPETGAPHTAHTINPVPICLVNGPSEARLKNGGRLADIAPTVLELLGVEQPAEMSGKSLLLSAGT